jgi:predicted signal transduction protein with EAL and GGDEF domain
MSPRFEQLLKISDEALYAAKDAGRDRAIVGHSHPAQEGKGRHATEHPATPDLQMIASA